MVYNNNFVAIIKHNGKVLREHNGQVQLPFGSEYSIGLKNKHTRKVLVTTSIDGEVIGNPLVLEPGQECDLDCFNKQHSNNNKFKFIEKTQQISDYRGDKIDDGIVTIEYQFEKYYPPIRLSPYKRIVTYDEPTFIGTNPWNNRTSDARQKLPGTYSRTTTCQSRHLVHDENILCASACNNSPMEYQELSEIIEDDGITVPGSKSNQTFTYGYIGTLENEKHVINIQLKGYSGKKKVYKPITTRTKIRCKTCGKMNTSRNVYCGDCGTNLRA